MLAYGWIAQGTGRKEEQQCRMICTGGNLPVRPGIVIYEREESLLYLVPALQAAPQPIRTDHMKLFALLCLAHLLCACRDNVSACLAFSTRVGYWDGAASQAQTSILLTTEDTVSVNSVSAPELFPNP